MRLELRHLRVVLAVADAGSMRKAAARLGIAQPGLTTQVQRIEHEFGSPLFSRNSGGVELTELGEHIRTVAGKVLREVDCMIDSAKQLNRGRPRAPIHVLGVLGPVVPMLVDAVHELLPDRSQVTTHMWTPEHVLDAAAQQCFDIGILPDRPRLPEGFASRPLVTEPAFIGMARSNPLADRSELDLRELARQDWVMPAETLSGLGPTLRTACEGAGFTPRCRCVGADTTTAVNMVRSGRAVAALYPNRFAEDVTLVPLRGNPVSRQLDLVWRRESCVEDAIDALHDKVITSYRALVAENPYYRRNSWL